MSTKLPTNRIRIYSQIKLEWEYQGLTGPQSASKTFTVNKQEIDLGPRKIVLDAALERLKKKYMELPNATESSSISDEGLAKTLVSVINALANVIEDGTPLHPNNLKQVAWLVHSLGGELKYSDYKARDNRIAAIKKAQIKK